MTTAKDPRPPVWVGHVVLETDRLDETAHFMQQLGMRPVGRSDEVCVLELRGGTHLVLLAKKTVTPGEASFDLMVEDLQAAHAQFSSLGLAPTAIEPAVAGHTCFKLREPAGHTITVFSSHVSGTV